MRVSRVLATPSAGGLALVVAAGFLLAPLARFWNADASGAYGWGVPWLAVCLAWERWSSRPEPRPAIGGSPFGLAAVLTAWAAVVLFARLVLETEPFSRPLLWMEASLLVGAVTAWSWLLGGRPWLRHFAFPAGFLFAGVPWIFGFELLVTQHLMRANAALVAATLHLLDFDAHAAGNTLVLPGGVLDVSEACSGIRSLQATLMMSLFLGEFYRYGWRGRRALLLAGTGLALAGNFLRLFYLAWQAAREGPAAVEAEHDPAGWSILIGATLALWAICLATRPRVSPRHSSPPPVPLRARLAAGAWALGVCAAALLAEVATQGWYTWREGSAPHYPAWSVAWPTKADDFRRVPVAQEVRAQLHAAEATAASWRDSDGDCWNGLWIRYAADAGGKVVFESHNPALCLPAAGWKPTGTTTQLAICSAKIQLAVECLAFRVTGQTAHVFWIPYLLGGMRAEADCSPGLYGHSLGALERGRAPWLLDVWHGCRGVRAETLELASSGPADEAQAEAAFRRLLPALIRPEATSDTPAAGD